MSDYLYKWDGTRIEVGGGAADIAKATKAEKPYGVRSNIVQTVAYVDAGSQRWCEVGLKFRCLKDMSSVTLNYSVNVTGTATKIQAHFGSKTQDNAYSGGTQNFTDTYAETLSAGDFVNFYIAMSTSVATDKPEYLGTARTLTIATLPEGLELVEEYVSRTPTLTVNTLTFDETTTYQTYLSRWKNKKWYAMGDSITQGVSPYYHQVAGQMLKMSTVFNGGLGGTSLVQWANDRLASRYYQGYDLITIMHGVNDHDNNPNSPIGTLLSHGSTFDKSTFIGAYQYIIETIQANSPNTEIALIKSTYVNNDNWVNNVGAKMSDYRAATQLVADSYGLPCFDASTVITAQNNATMTSDGVHPTAAGQALLGEAIGKWLATI